MRGRYFDILKREMINIGDKTKEDKGMVNSVMIGDLVVKNINSITFNKDRLIIECGLKDDAGDPVMDDDGTYELKKKYWIEIENIKDADVVILGDIKKITQRNV